MAKTAAKEIEEVEEMEDEVVEDVEDEVEEEQEDEAEEVEEEEEEEKSATKEEEDESSKPKKPKSTVTPAKRPTTMKTAIEDTNRKSEKRRKKNNDSVEEESKKKKPIPFQRVWSEEDEIIILKGMVKYNDKGLDVNEFYTSIKNLLHVEVTKEQLNDKIRRLKGKYIKNALNEKEGKEMNFPKPHDAKLYELSKKIWSPIKSLEAKNGATVDSVTKVAKKNSRKAKGVVVLEDSAIAKQNVPHLQSESVVEKEEERNVNHFSLMNEFMKSGKGKDLIRPPSSWGREFLGLGLVGSSKKAKEELDQKWRKLQIAETKLYLDRLELLWEDTKMVLDALLESSSTS
ncbi:Protein of unknown function DUF573 [Macleaya cordata]|uniref:Glabrous enhancer-binding protein-like DBD domain-containing protein n=1 Tax=Macleaya cordata TaxID=56857 RepID=A0A200Q8S2_MACCD|nr:Protein of unknown function DUF573 [Macleaya cordata]OVA06868.1 Protein of unknown function DUF573 [Macleaya cordata]